MLDKTYQPAKIEPRINKMWDDADAFKCGQTDEAAEPFCIVIPPPNVTGSLHMGHALNNTLQDILCRFERMRGKDVLWQPGMDHAGIATQMVVERQMAARQEPDRRTIGREKFLEKVWAWKAESGGKIGEQLRRLGASCDWSRERFTMDDGLSEAVLKVFVELYRAGLIYRDKRLVNWDPKFQTAISDLEVEQVENKGKLWHFKYPLKDDPNSFITIATTRPETMLGDTAIAVHPDDERYKHLVGKMAVLPLVGREIPIVADEYSDPEKGSGAVKITPAHDFNDFEVGKRHNLEQICIFDVNANINDEAPEQYRGMDRFEARKKIISDLEELELLVEIEEIANTVPHGDRSGVVIEPMLTDQWYVDAKTLAKPAIEAVENGDTSFVPKNWEKTYFEWMRNIEPWCISRQLWWGHQIPAWYGPDGEVFVASNVEEAAEAALRHYVEKGDLSQAEADKMAADKTSLSYIKRDEDVLDTWFSSALWPFSTLGWPADEKDVARYYPTSVLITGFDIIFFWVARMMMMGLHFRKEIPFQDVYIHALVRDEKGRKMSKSLGNVMDPIDIIEGVELETLVEKRVSSLPNNNPEQFNRDKKLVTNATKSDYPKGINAYGADALRFTLAIMAAQGRDVKMSMSRVEGYRNFATKLWNASRFAEMNECVRQQDFDPANVSHMTNQWIVGEVDRAVETVTTALEGYKFNEAAGTTYEFVWGVFCDWYLELVKPILTGDDEALKAETRATVAWVLDQILKLLHPFMPFITEELWAHMVNHGVKRRTLLTQSTWPSVNGLLKADADEEVNWVIRLISEIRSVRSEMNIPGGAQIPLVVTGDSKRVGDRMQRHQETVRRVARLDDISFAKSAPKGAALLVIGDTTFALPLEGVIDMEAERARLAKEITAAEKDLAKMNAKLSNPKFVERAKPEAVEETKERKAELEDMLQRLSAAVAWVAE